MVATSGSSWGPAALPVLLVAQLEARGLTPSDAPVCVQRITAAGPAAPTALFVDLGACRMLDGDVDGSLAAWRHAVASTEPVAASRALLNLGLLYEHLGLHQKALPALTTASQRRVEPFATQAALARARCQRSLGQPAEAMETMARLADSLLGQAPSSELSEIMLGLGDIASEAGRIDSAERAWRAAAGGTGSSAQTAIGRLIALEIEQGRDDELVGLVEASAAPADLAAMILDRAAVLASLGRTGLARELSALVAPAPLNVPDRFRLAQVRLQLGQVNEAIDEYESLLGSADVGVRQRAGFALGEIYRSYEMLDPARAMLDRVAREADRYWSPKAERLLAELRGTPTVSSDGDPGVAPGSVSANPDAAIESRPTEDDPVIVVLSEVSAGPTPSAPVDDGGRNVAPVNNGAGQVPAANAFAGLVVDEHECDVAPSTRNPYAELAPNFDATAFELPEDVQAGDWESLLGDWTTDTGPDPAWEPPNKSSRKRAFSRYT